jgi:hypothetical protein
MKERERKKKKKRKWEQGNMQWPLAFISAPFLLTRNKEMPVAPSLEKF